MTPVPAPDDAAPAPAAATVPLSPALVVDDDPGMRRRLAGLLQRVSPGAAVAEAGSLAEAHAHLGQADVALALVDVGLPDGSGCALVGWLHAHRPATASLVISAWGHDDTVLAALRAGAVGYLLKERDDLELELSLRSIQRGGAPIDPAIARRILALLPPPAAAAEAPQAPVLSEREREVLHLVSRGCSNREIAELTGLSRFTVEDHTKAIYRKLAVGSRTEAVFEAQRMGLLR
jgi:DNA-binding NarL/FixJ family response regulator